MRKLFALVSVLLACIRLFILALVFLTIMALALPHIQNVSNYSYLEPLINYERKMNEAVKASVPTRIANVDMSRVITLLALLILLAYLSHFRRVIVIKNKKEAFINKLDLLKVRAKTREQRETISQFEQKVENQSFKTKNRQELLKEFVKLKKELEKSGRNLAFLSIDVVDSTGMKEGEDAVIVENDFNQYHDFVLNIFKENGYIKASWTPDGVMACFNTTEQAIKAARSLIRKLEFFNKNTKVMKRDFLVRCGINSGFVYYDLATPLEEFGDRVIDIAGHMQKNARPNTIFVAKEIIKPIKTYEDFEKTQVLVDGFEVCEWAKNQSME